MMNVKVILRRKVILVARIAVVLIGRHSVDHLDGLGVVAAEDQCTALATSASSLQGKDRIFS
jgi:hypothetical protein